MFLPKASEVVLGEYAYPIHNDWRIYVRVNRMLSCREMFDWDKIVAICRMVYVDEIDPSVEAVEGFLRLFSQGKGGEPCFDLEQDAELIYAGFMQAYRIDLNTAEMSIEEFLALLKGLPEGTKFAEVVKIRTMPVPVATKFNASERSAIMRAKASVALKGRSDIGAGLRSLAEMMRVWNGR